MLLLKSMDRFRSRVALFLAIHLFIPAIFVIYNINLSFADSTKDDRFPNLDQSASDPKQKSMKVIFEETNEKLKQVYGPPSPEGSEEVYVFSSTSISKSVNPPSTAKPADKTAKPLEQASVPKSEKTKTQTENKAQASFKSNKDDAMEAENLKKAKLMEQKLIEERAKLKKQGTDEEGAGNQHKKKPENMVRLSDKSGTADLLKKQKLEQKHYGMTLNELSTQWSAFREKIQGPNTPVNYKTLSKEEKKLVSSKVKFEQEQAKERMPIIDRGYFREVITKDIIISQENFLHGEDKSLQDVVKRALDTSNEVKLAQEKKDAGVWRARKAFRDLFTTINFELISKRGSLTNAFVSDMQRLNFKQPLFHGGNLWNLFREEAATSKANAEEVEKSTQKLILDVAEAYMNYSRAQTLFNDKSEIAAKMQKFKMQNEEKRKVGAVSEIEYLNTDSLVSEIDAELQTAHQELALAQIDLAKFLSLPKNQKINVESIDSLKDKINIVELTQQSHVPIISSPEDISNINTELNELVDLAYQNRADLRLEEYKLMANRYKVKANYGKWLPQADVIIEFGELAEAFKDVDDTPPYHNEFKFGIEVGQNLLGNNFKYSFDTTQTAPSVSAFQGQGGTRINQNKFTVGILDGLQQFVDVKEARAQLLEQVVELQEKENEVVKEVKESYYGYHKSLIQLDSAIKKLEHKERVAKLKSYQLEKNQIQISEYLQAEKDWLDAKGLYTEAVADYYKNRIALNKAIGAADLLQIEGSPFPRKES